MPASGCPGQEKEKDSNRRYININMYVAHTHVCILYVYTECHYRGLTRIES